jgi:1,4-dihydroxy-2-naphthoyl-CoA hydrolase
MTNDASFSGQSGLDELRAVMGIRGTLGERMGLVITEASPERVVGTMPVEGNTQPLGLWHGGASCVLAESLGSVGASLHAARLHGGYAVGIEISATHHRGLSTGTVTGVATPLHLGGQIATYDIVITDEEGRRVCTCRLTCMLRRR